MIDQYFRPIGTLTLMIVLAMLIAAAALRIWTDLQVSAVNAGHRLPVTWGRFAVPLSRKIRTIRLISSAATLWGALALGGAMYDYRNPTPSFVVTAIIVVMVLYVPSAVITAIHNRRYDGHALER